MAGQPGGQGGGGAGDAALIQAPKKFERSGKIQFKRDFSNIPNEEVDARATGGLLRKFKVNGLELTHHGTIFDAIFAPSEKRVATAGGDCLIKIWDPRDGLCVRVLRGHGGEVCSLKYSSDELFLVSASGDGEIFLWDMTSNNVFKKLRGHIDVVTRLAASPDCSLIISSSIDRTMKTWYLTPRAPDSPDPPRIISKTDKTVMLAWSAPPSFTLEVTAFQIQWRVGLREAWQPPDETTYVPGGGPIKPFSVTPMFRSKVIKGLVSATPYQFRIRAQNRMGLGPWSAPSKLTPTDLGIPERPEQPAPCGASKTSITIYWFTGNPETFGGASRKFEVQRSGEGKGFEDHPIVKISLDQGVIRGRKVLNYFREKLLEPFKKVKIMQRKEKLLQEKEEDMGMQFSTDKMEEFLKRAEDITLLFSVVDIDGLKPGFTYRFMVRGVNDSGEGKIERIVNISCFR